MCAVRVFFGGEVGGYAILDAALVSFVFAVNACVNTSHVYLWVRESQETLRDVMCEEVSRSEDALVGLCTSELKKKTKKKKN